MTTDATADVAVSPAARIGASIRTLRRRRGLTLVQLATASGLSHPFLSQVERGVANPSIDSLQRISRALGVGQLDILSVADDEEALTPVPAHVVRADEGRVGGYGLGRARLLTAGDVHFQPMLFAADNVDPGEYLVHAEDEFVTVIAGLVEIDLGDAGAHRLGAGDSIYYAGGTPHRWRSLDGDEYRMFVVKDSIGPAARRRRGAPQQ